MSRLRVRDAAAALALFVVALIEVLPGGLGGDRLVALIFSSIATLAVAGRRVAPVTVSLVTTAGLAFGEALAFDVDVEASLLATLLALWTLGERCERRVATRGAVANLMIVWLGVVLSPTHDLPSFIFTGIAIGAPVLGGQALRTVTDRSERDRLVEAKLAVDDERARIARELHDIVAHGVSLMVLQASAAQRVARTDPAGAGDALDVIEHVGRSSLKELQRMLGVLRDGAGEHDPLEPQPGLADIPVLVEGSRAAGVTVGLQIDGLDLEVPHGVSLAAYRIVQEALTNARRHAPGAAVTVAVRVGNPALEVEIADDGDGGARSSEGAGHGLIGMRERVRLYNGEMDAGPAPSGGWIVHARLPLGAP